MNEPKKPKANQFAMTHEEIASEIGLTRATVSIIEARAYEKVKRALKRKGIKIEDVLVDSK